MSQSMSIAWPCRFPDCGQPSLDNRVCLCRGHDGQHYDGYPPVPGRRRQRRPDGTTQLRDGYGRKQCYICEEWKNVPSFIRAKTEDGLRPECRSCHGALLRLYAYGLTRERYEAMLAAQGGGCAICLRVPSAAAEPRKLNVDHDHACCPAQGRSCGECVRGLLCDRCNTMIARLNDDAAVFQRAADYLLAPGRRRGVGVEPSASRLPAGIVGQDQGRGPQTGRPPVSAKGAPVHRHSHGG